MMDEGFETQALSFFKTWNRTDKKTAFVAKWKV
jgi:hypothetical protein